MKQEATRLREMIERATAAPDIADDELPQALDAETASLRNGWLQLGKLIEQEVRSGAKHVCHRTHCANNMPAAARRRQPGWALWIAVSAASLFIAAGIAFAVRLFGAPQEPQNNLPRLAESDVPQKQPAAPAVVHTPAPPQASVPDRHIAETGDHLQWGDSVDDEIAAVGEATIYAKEDIYARSNVWELETGLDDLKQEVEQGSL